MKKKLTAILALVMMAALVAVPAHAAVTAGDLEAYGQNTIDIYELEGDAPVVDGVVDVAYGDPVQEITNVYDSSVCYYTISYINESQISDVLPEWVTTYMTYDDTYLYIAIQNADPDHCTPKEGTGTWEGDYLDFDIIPADHPLDQIGDRTRFCMGLSDSGKSASWFDTAPAFTSGTLQYPRSTVLDDPNHSIAVHEDGITTYEARLAWTDILGEKPADGKFLNYVQLGIGDSRYADKSEYAAYLGTFRNIYCMTDADVAALAAESGVAAGSLDKRAFNVMVLAGPAPIPVVEETAEETTEATASVNASTFDAATVAVAASIISLLGYAVSKKR